MGEMTKLVTVVEGERPESCQELSQTLDIYIQVINAMFYVLFVASFYQCMMGLKAG